MKISVVIPTYNRAKLLARAIESALAQTRPVDEIIVVDDGSRDDTRAMAATFGSKIHYIHQENRGLAGARNTGIRAASGDWIALLDDDDAWLPDGMYRLEQSALACPPAVLVYGSFWVQEIDGTRKVTRVPDAGDLWPALRRTNFLAPSSVMFRKDAVIEAGGFDERIRVCEDWDLWVRLRSQHPFAAVLTPTATLYRSAETLSRDIDRMLNTSEQILETTLLAGLRNWERPLWRRRVRSAQLASAAITAKEAGSAGRERSLIIKSIIQWPLPTLLPKRYAALTRALMGPGAYGLLTKTLRYNASSKLTEDASKDT